ncbi:hypothetical protein C5B42_00830 [Candidatus Cerribacteria bacterium 'Amazon FNV 2010 28 9']|uniref:Glycosyltransferase RgtA/B/C/D-like domain-containing protein n=1 Tax=Candidatus Cerribacteria bacterium 'Amazon FNV 2010 28 9' TaxID=2081795 RepID=A0A317JPS1_9BACT|nr:MAG: hypothetical protein C5B42_00830 [Candidatus Cerribacteria bacterium 'Amazon FNV 2010 28 9']
MTLFSSLQKKLEKVPQSLWVGGIYFLSHLLFMTKLPVFADEAIYIRWAQLIQDDAPRYFFFSMADGKPPLFIWFLSLILYPFQDPLFAGRLLAVFIGFVQVLVVGRIVALFTKKKSIPLIGMILCTFLPFWFFYDRMALMDGLLTLLLSLAFLFSLRLVRSPAQRKGNLQFTIYNFQVWDILGLAFSFGGALMTKTPALFAIPIIAIVPFLFYEKKFDRKKTIRAIVPIGIGGFVGCLVFLTLRISPLFGALFARSSDFTFSIHDVIGGEWKYILFTSTWKNLWWIVYYLSPPSILLLIVGLCSKQRKNIVSLLVCAFLFFVPLTVLGRVLYPRYFLPSALFVTVALSLCFEGLTKRTIKWSIVMLSSLCIGMHSLYFIGTSFFDIAHIPFVPADSVQYLEEWSAGFGNKEVENYVRTLAIANPQKHYVVLTEGSFGTLPDGILMYFHGSTSLPNVEIHGIGVDQSSIPSEYVALARTEEVFYMVNSHRFKIAKLESISKIFEVDRPNSAPTLQLYKVTGL